MEEESHKIVTLPTGKVLEFRTLSRSYVKTKRDERESQQERERNYRNSTICPFLIMPLEFQHRGVGVIFHDQHR